MPAFAGKIDTAFLGNWIDPATGEWTYGFYEDFAVYGGDYWKYKQIDSGKNRISVELENGPLTLRVVLVRRKDGSVRIKEGKKKERPMRKYDGVFVPYPSADTASFAPPAFRTDTAVLTGYFPNLHRHAGGFAEPGTGFVRAILPDAAGRETVISVPVDSCGRFAMALPLFAPTEVTLDNGRPIGKLVFYPGERTFACIGATGSPGDTTGSARPVTGDNGPVVFMGGQARLHNEQLAVPAPSLLPAGTLAAQAVSDSGFLAAARKDYEEKSAEAERFMAGCPTLSERTVQAVRSRYLYAHGYVLLHYLTGKSGGPNGSAVDPALTGYLAQTFPAGRQSDLFLSMDFPAFARKYVDYLEITAAKPEQNMDWLLGWWQRMVHLGAVPEEDRTLLEPMTLINDPEFRQRAEADTALRRPFELAVERMTRKLPEYLNSLEGQAVAQLHLLDDGLLARVRQVMPDTVVQQWVLTRLFIEKQGREQTPFLPVVLRFYNERVPMPVFRDCLYASDAALREKLAAAPYYAGSLCDATPLAGYTDPEKLLARLLEPYRGKVVYLDVWGAWCAPCRRQMVYAREIEKAYRGKEVAFVCLANKTSEADWKEAVRTWGISGENIFHYCLPAAQQESLEQYLQVTSFPTYLLFDKEGRLKNRKAPTPFESDRLLPLIDGLLAE